MSANLASARLRLPWRLMQLEFGLVLYGVSLTLMVRAGLGVGPWDVFHLGLARLLDVRLGWVTIGVSALVLLAWIPLRNGPASEP